MPEVRAVTGVLSPTFVARATATPRSARKWRRTLIRSYQKRCAARRSCTPYESRYAPPLPVGGIAHPHGVQPLPFTHRRRRW